MRRRWVRGELGGDLCGRARLCRGTGRWRSVGTCSCLQLTFGVDQEVCGSGDEIAGLESFQYCKAIVGSRSKLHFTWIEMSLATCEENDLSRSALQHSGRRNKQLAAED